MIQFSFLPADESRDLADYVRALFDDLDSHLSPGERAQGGADYQPAVDVRETDTAVEVIVDVCGIPPQAIRVLYRKGVLVIAGEKAPGPLPRERTFHLVEREFGRFVRAIAVPGAFDIPHAEATAANGELIVVLPKRAERRGQAHRIVVQPAAASPDAGRT